MATNFGNIGVVGILWGSNWVSRLLARTIGFKSILFEVYNLVLYETKLRGFAAAIFEKPRGVARRFPKKEAKSVYHVLVAS